MLHLGCGLREEQVPRYARDDDCARPICVNEYARGSAEVEWHLPSMNRAAIFALHRSPLPDRPIDSTPLADFSGRVIAADGVPEEIVRRTLDRFGRVDILVNNAALAASTRFGDLSADEWRLALEVNLTAPFLLTKAVLPAMKAQGYGRIINISSSAGRMVSTLGGAHYTASKAGLLGLTRASAKELGAFGITVNAICPGMIDTELTHEHAADELLERLAGSYPVPRLGTAREVADLICFAASEAAGYLTGTSLDINGGDLMM